MDADQELLFKDLGATAEQTVVQVRGLKESYFSVLQKRCQAFLGSQT
jgi:hypothetical protein